MPDALPGSPWENAYADTFNGKLEDELLGGVIFFTLPEARVLIEQYRVEYNHERPHSSLGYRTPAEFAAGSEKVETPREPSFPHTHPDSHNGCTENGALPVLGHYFRDWSLNHFRQENG